MNAGSEAVRSNGPHQSSRPVGRKRRVAGWALVTAGVIVAALWVASGWWIFSRNEGGQLAFISSGLVLYVDGGPPGEVRWMSKRKYEWSGWTLKALGNDFSQTNVQDWVIVARYDLKNPQVKCVNVAFWPVPLLLWTPAALLLRSGILARRRANTGSCAKCGYSLAGLAADSPCPECGKAKTV